MMTVVDRRRCESCGRFVSNRHMRTARYSYSVDPTLPIAVYSLATATKYQERLVCASCSMQCFRMVEAGREYGIAVGASFPGGWEVCDPGTTQADYGPRAGQMRDDLAFGSAPHASDLR